MPDDDEVQDVGVRPFWSGTISFGLVSIPVNLYAATRAGGVHLRMLGPEGEPLRRVYACPKDGQVLEDDDLIRGYELEKGGDVVTVTDDELEALAPEKSRDIDLRRFVPRDDLDPLFFERAYLLGPAGESTKAYRLLAATMEKSDRAGIATFVMRGKEHLVAILSDRGLLRAETLRFHDEVRSPDDVGLPAPPDEVDATRVKRFLAATQELCEEEPPLERLEDDHAAAVRALVKEKTERGEGVLEVHEAAAAAVDLMALIQKSLAGKDGEEERPRRARTKREAARRKPGGRRRSPPVSPRR